MVNLISPIATHEEDNVSIASTDTLEEESSWASDGFEMFEEFIGEPVPRNLLEHDIKERKEETQKYLKRTCDSVPEDYVCDMSNLIEFGVMGYMG